MKFIASIFFLISASAQAGNITGCDLAMPIPNVKTLDAQVGKLKADEQQMTAQFSNFSNICPRLPVPHTGPCGNMTKVTNNTGSSATAYDALKKNIKQVQTSATSFATQMTNLDYKECADGLTNSTKDLGKTSEAALTKAKADCQCGG